MNVALLEYEMKIRRVGKDELCEELGISRTAFYRKCNGKSEFKQSEILKIVHFLGVTNLEAIFFDEPEEK